MLEGAGKSTSIPFTIDNIGCFFNILICKKRLTKPYPTFSPPSPSDSRSSRCGTAKPASRPLSRVATRVARFLSPPRRGGVSHRKAGRGTQRGCEPASRPVRPRPAPSRYVAPLRRCAGPRNPPEGGPSPRRLSRPPAAPGGHRPGTPRNGAGPPPPLCGARSRAAVMIDSGANRTHIALGAIDLQSTSFTIQTHCLSRLCRRSCLGVPPLCRPGSLEASPGALA